MVDITGNKYNKLTAVKLDRKTDREYWLFQCECGNTKVINKTSVVTGRAKSCGCLRAEKVSRVNLIDGRKKNPLYPIWRSIIQRCTNPNDKSYKDYGSRGVNVCVEWQNDFNLFNQWCIDNGWIKGLEIDRIDNDKGYYPNNCRFVERKDNARNKRSNIKVLYNGEMICLKELSEKTGLPYQRIKTDYHNGKLSELLGG